MSVAPPLTAITAAGLSRRMGRPKALLPWGGRTLLERMAEALDRAGLPRPAVVLGAHRERMQRELDRLGLETIDNPLYERGRFTSVRAAARWALGRDAGRSLLLWPVDCPGVRSETLMAMAGAGREHPRSNIAPSSGGRGGHPILLCPETVGRVAGEGDDANLRELVRQAAGGRVLLPVADRAVLENLNSPDDYLAFLVEHAAAPGSASDGDDTPGATEGRTR